MIVGIFVSTLIKEPFSPKWSVSLKLQMLGAGCKGFHFRWDHHFAGCRFGLHASGGAKGVGLATTMSVVGVFVGTTSSRFSYYLYTDSVLAMIRFENVVKQFGTFRVLDGLNLHIPEAKLPLSSASRERASRCH